MSKGLIGIVIPGMVIGAWIALTGQWKIIWQARLLTGLIIFLIIAAPWHLLMAGHYPDFLNFYFIHEHFTRYLTDEHKRTAPWWFFIAVTAVGLLPWTTPHLLRGPAHQALGQVRGRIFLLLWIILPFIFFSTSHSKLISYIFPIFPPLAILIGRTLDDILQNRAPVKILRVNAVIMATILTAILVATQLLPVLPGKAGQKFASLTAISMPMLLPIALALLWLCYTFIKNRSPKSYIVALAIASASIGFTANYAIVPLNPSTKSLAMGLKEQLYPGDMVVAYGTYWQDLPVYLNRNVTVVDWTGELSFGVDHYPETHEWMIPAEEFWKRCASAQRGIYVFINEDGFKTLPAHEDCKLNIIAQSGKILLLEKTHD